MGTYVRVLGEKHMTAPKKYVVTLDGDKWMAFDESTFVDLQESVAEFGDTPLEALSKLLEREGK